MAPERAPAFQFYPKDFLTDGNVAGMSLQERGAYISLLCLCWLERSLPDDIGRLANLVGVPRSSMVRLWPAIGRCFRTSPTDQARLIHPRLEAERRKQDEYRRRQSDAGKLSASNRKATAVQPDDNHGSTEPQPESNSALSDLPSAVSSLLEKQEQEKAAAPTPHRFQPREEPHKNLTVITKIAHEAIDIEGIDADLGQLADAVKSLCSVRGIDYNTDVVRKAVDSALHQRRRAS